MKAVKVLGLIVLFGLMITGVASARELKIAYFDLAKVFDNYPKTREFDAVLQKEGQRFEETRNTMLSKIRDEQNKLDLMRDSEKTKLKDVIAQDKNKVIAFDQEKRTELAKRRDEKLREILSEIQKAAAAIAHRDGYDIVLNDRVLIYADPGMNITNEVMKSLNETTN